MNSKIKLILNILQINNPNDQYKNTQNLILFLFFSCKSNKSIWCVPEKYRHVGIHEISIWKTHKEQMDITFWIEKYYLNYLKWKSFFFLGTCKVVLYILFVNKDPKDANGNLFFFFWQNGHYYFYDRSTCKVDKLNKSAS